MLKDGTLCSKGNMLCVKNGSLAESQGHLKKARTLKSYVELFDNMSSKIGSRSGTIDLGNVAIIMNMNINFNGFVIVCLH